MKSWRMRKSYRQEIDSLRYSILNTPETTNSFSCPWLHRTFFQLQFPNLLTVVFVASPMQFLRLQYLDPDLRSVFHLRPLRITSFSLSLFSFFLQVLSFSRLPSNKPNQVRGTQDFSQPLSRFSPESGVSLFFSVG